MIDDDTPPTELQRSQSTGVRCFLVSPNHFGALAAQIEEPRKLDMVHTLSSFRPAASYPVSPAGDIMVRCRGNQISAADDTLIAQAVTAGIIDEVTVAEFTALLPEPTNL
tara:strand:- start:1282 stop:1611 length:330 start_codon:yes stop_codon:yes gene_type:complete